MAIQAMGERWDAFLARARQEAVEAAGLRALRELDGMLPEVRGKDRIRVCEVVIKVWLCHKRTAAIPTGNLQQELQAMANRLREIPPPPTASAEPAAPPNE